MIIIIGCTKSKAFDEAPAYLMYSSDLFKKRLAYKKKFYKNDKLLILSAHYGLISPKTIIKRYDSYLPKMGKKERLELKKLIKKEIKDLNLNPNEECTVLAGKDYVNLISDLLNITSTESELVIKELNLKFNKLGNVKQFYKKVLLN